MENDRYSFACAWGDLNSDGAPDLYVANDFGRSNLYRNNGDGTFTAVSSEAGVEDAGAGMSACWFDFRQRREPGHLRGQYVVRRRPAGFRTRDFPRERS